MRKIAYKTANHPKSAVKGSLPDNYITEFTYLDLNPDIDQNEWTVVNEDEFNNLLSISNTEEEVRKHDDKISKEQLDEFNLMVAEQEAKRAAEQAAKDLEKAAYEAEFEEFIAWKKSKEK